MARRARPSTGLKLAADLSVGQLASDGGLQAPDQGGKSSPGRTGRRRARRGGDALGLLFGPAPFAPPAEAIALRDSGMVVRKLDNELQVVWAEVYLPDVLDTQDDFATADEVRKFAWDFCAAGLSQQVDTNHDGDVLTPRAAVVETFVARAGDPTFLPGAWVVAIKVADPGTWAKIKRGDINGFSLEARAHRSEVELEVEVPEEAKGRTMAAAGHDHEWVVRWGSDGQFLGGEALPAIDPATGALHSHAITRGTVTDSTGDHSHRYSVSEALLGLAKEGP